MITQRGANHWRRRGIIAGAVLLFFGSLILAGHLYLRSGRGGEFIARQLESGISALIPGELEIDHLELRSYFEIAIQGARLRDEEGRVVLEGDQLNLTLEARKLLGGELSISEARLEGATLTLYEGRGDLPSFLSALIDESETDDSEGGLIASAPSIAVRDLSIEGTLAGVEGLAMSGVQLDASIHYDDRFLLEITGIEGVIAGPLDAALMLRGGEARVDAAPENGSQVRLEIGDEERSLLALDLDYREVEGEDRLELNAKILDLPAELLAALGLLPEELIVGALSDEITLEGEPSALGVSGSVNHPAGGFDLSGEIGASIKLRVKSERLEAAALIPTLPEIATSVDVTVEIPSGPDADEITVDAELGAFNYEGFKIPPTKTRLRLRDDHLVVERSEAEMRHGAIEASGLVHFDGRLDLTIDADLPSTRAFAELGLPLNGAEGGTKLRLHLRGDASAPELDTAATISPFIYGPIYIRRLALSGMIDRLLEDPNLRIRVRANGIRVFDEPTPDLDLTLRGAGSAYRASGHVLDGSGGVAEGRFDLGREFRLHHAKIAGGVFKFDAREIRVGETKTTIEFLRVQHGGGLLDISGTLSEDDPGDLSASLSNVAISDIRQFIELPFPALEGKISAEARVEGALRKDPKLSAQGALLEVTGGGLDGAIATFFYRHENGQSLGQAQVDLGERGLGELGLNVYIDLTERDLDKMLEEAFLDLFVNVYGFDVTLLHALLGDSIPQDMPEETLEMILGATALLDAELEMLGMIDALDLRGTISSDAIHIPGQPTLGAELRATSEYGSFTSRLTVSDDHGALGYVEGSTRGNQLALLRDPANALELLNYAPWIISAQLNERLLRDLPSEWRELIPEQLHELGATLHMEAKGGSLAPAVEGSGKLNLPPGSELDCAIPQDASLPFRFSIHEGEATLEGEFLLGTRAYGDLRASAPIPLARFLERGAIEPVPIEASVVLSKLRAETLPLVCDNFSGLIDAEIRARYLFGESPRAEALFHSGALRIKNARETSTHSDSGRVMESAPLNFAATIEIDDKGSEVDLIVRASANDRLSARGRAPLRLIPGGLAEFPEDEELALFVSLERAPLAVPLAFTNALSSVEGYADGWGSLRGTLKEPTYYAELSIDEARFTIASLGQRLSSVHGVASLSPGTLELRHLEAKDGRGGVKLYGEMSLDGFEPERASLHIELDEFPIRNEGSVVASISGQGEVNAEIESDRADAQMELRKIEVTMPSLSGPSIQALSPHPDIILVDAERQIDEEGAGFDLTLRIDANRGFEVNGPDFSASLRADLIVDLIADQIRIGGSVNLEKGRFAVLGKPFEIVSGSLRFDREDETLSPTILVEAMYYLDSRRDKYVSVSIAGTLSDPSVRFASNVPTEGEGEIISLIITGDTRGAGDSMSQDAAAAGRDAADFVAGIAFGVVSLSLREEFGGFLPMITLEGQNRFRARFDAEQFLPERVRRILQRARIEGYFTAGQENEQGHVRQSGQAQDIGFSIELGFPRGIVGRGTISPPNRWAADLVWEP